MKKNKIKKIITISAVVLLMIATLGTFAAFFGKSDFVKVKDKWNDIKDKFQQEEVVSNVNLLSNSNFQINTSGIDVFTNENAGTINSTFMDGWMNPNGKECVFEMNIVDNGLFVKVSEDSANEFHIKQSLNEPGLVIGQTVTMSFSVNDIVYSGTVSLVDGVWNRIDGSGVEYSMVLQSAGGVSVFVCFEQGFEGVVNWVQLELGNTFTGYVAPVVA